MIGLIIWTSIVAIFGVFFSIHETYLYCKQKEPPKLFNDCFELAKFTLLGYTLVVLPLCLLYSV